MLRNHLVSGWFLGIRPGVLAIGVAALILGGCEGDPGSGATAVKWDRYTCERCRMVLSDRRHGAQIRHRRADGRSKVHYFDDIGCAVIWLQDKPFRDAPTTQIWVTDWRSGDWIDGRTASYLPGQLTPMEYGLGAQPDVVEGALNFAAAKAHIFDLERRFNSHGGHLAPSTADRR